MSFINIFSSGRYSNKISQLHSCFVYEGHDYFQSHGRHLFFKLEKVLCCQARKSMSFFKLVFTFLFLVLLSEQFCSYLWDSLKKMQNKVLLYFLLVRYQMPLNCGLWAMAVSSVIVQKGFVSLGFCFSIYWLKHNKRNQEAFVTSQSQFSS